MGVALLHAAAVDCGMPHSLCGPRAVYPPSLAQPFLPPVLTVVPCAAATCRCPARRGVATPSAANLCRALQPKPHPAQYVAVVWLYPGSCRAFHVPAPPCHTGFSAVQHLVVAGAVGRHCGLQEESEFVVLAGCNGGCHWCMYTAHVGGKACFCAVHTI